MNDTLKVVLLFACLRKKNLKNFPRCRKIFFLVGRWPDNVIRYAEKTNFVLFMRLPNSTITTTSFVLIISAKSVN